MKYTGVIIEESLEDTSVLKDLTIVSTKVEKITKEHQTPWLAQWTLHTVEIAEDKAVAIAAKLSTVIETAHDSCWYADFKNDTTHFIIFPNRVFKIDRTKKKQYDEAVAYGLSQGIPDYQLDFSPFIKEWER